MKQKKSTIKFLKKNSKKTHNESSKPSSTLVNKKKSNKTNHNKQKINKQDQLELDNDDNGSFIKLKDNSKR